MGCRRDLELAEVTLSFWVGGAGGGGGTGEGPPLPGLCLQGLTGQTCCPGWTWFCFLFCPPNQKPGLVPTQGQRT